MSGAIFALVGALATTAAGQIQYKKFSRGHKHRDLVAAMGFFVITLPLTYIAVKAFGIGLVYMCTSFNYVAVAIAGQLLFGERLSRRRLLAIFLIVSGTSIYALGLY